MVAMAGQSVTAGQAIHKAMWGPFVDDVVSLPCTVKYAAFDAAAVAAGNFKTVAVVGTKASLEALCEDAGLPEVLQGYLKAMIPKLSAKPLKVASKATTVLGHATVEDMVVGLVTDEHSRVTAKHRPDQVRGFVHNSVPAKEGTLLIVALPEAGAADGWLGSVAKGHHLCSIKGAHDGFDPARPAPVPVHVWCPGTKFDERVFERAQVIGESIQLAARLVDTPTNYLNTVTYTAIAEGLAKRFGLKAVSYQGEEIQEQGMGLLFHVGRAAEYPASLVVLTAEGQATAEGAVVDENVCWVGKGIVYDTGGLAIKSKDGMCGMKHDMGGSAGVLGGFIAAARLGVRVKNLHCLLALADNAINDRAVRNDDVVRCMSGTTVQINNTDAEGRLVLSDAVAYAHKHLSPSLVVTMATLTGAQGIATGKHFAAVCANTDAIEGVTVAAGKQTGDQCYPVLFAPELLMHEFDCTCADMKNSVACRTNAQVSCAGLFIYKCGFAGKYTGEWAHIDMAYPVTMEDERASGWGPLLLENMLQGYQAAKQA
eukprot:TRINITY_DN2419_c0_g1_i1.p1 TRINITY_DN2419_c0_g1~~TRINITY_DN2419_c0_g1_i1.p1  ORF type:complete len:554 (+),score=252.25 TRINITY_DN2419_c0_g1_i1:45-1664(+)